MTKVNSVDPTTKVCEILPSRSVFGYTMCIPYVILRLYDEIFGRILLI